MSAIPENSEKAKKLIEKKNAKKSHQKLMNSKKFDKGMEKAISKDLPESLKMEKIVSPLEDEKLETINLSKFADRIGKMQEQGKLKESSSLEIRSHLYIYPDGKNNKEWINGYEGKNWRNARRSFMKKICNNIIIAYSGKKESDVKNLIVEFDKNYKEFYSCNNYELNSISNSRETDLIKLALEIIKDCKGY